MKQWIWNILDPALRKMYRRMEHLRQLESEYVNPGVWAPVARLGHDVTFHRGAVLINPSTPEAMVIGDKCRIYGQLWIFGEGKLSIGHHSFVGAGSKIWCNSSVQIGSHVLISHLVDIHDCDSHSLNWRERRTEIHTRFDSGIHEVPPGVATMPVMIGDDVWIGFKSTILKGVKIGKGAVVAAGSVVTKDVPPCTLVAGNPARVMRELQS